MAQAARVSLLVGLLLGGQVGLVGTATSQAPAPTMTMARSITSDAHSTGGTATALRIGIPFGTPFSIALRSNGDLYIAEFYDHIVQRLDHATGLLTTIAGTGTAGYSGDGGLATAAQLSSPSGVALDAAGDLFVADAENNVVRRIDHATGRITTVAGTGQSGFSGDGGPATAAQLASPEGLAIDAAGDLFIADYFNNVVRHVDHATGRIITVAGTGGWATSRYAGDGGPATAARMFYPSGVAVDAAGNLFIADFGNSMVRRVDHATHVITTIAGSGWAGVGGDGGPSSAAQLNEPHDVALDAASDLFIADAGNDSVRRIDHATGVITTVAGLGKPGYNGDGGPATAAHLQWPLSVAIDAAGNLYIADARNEVVRRVDHATGLIATVAGVAPRLGTSPSATPTPTATPVPPLRIVGQSPPGDLLSSAWLPAFRTLQPQVHVSFTAVGTAASVAALASGRADLVLRNEPLTAAQVRIQATSCGGRALHLPVAVDAMGLVYNLPGVAHLSLSPALLGALFGGHVRRWNDQRLVRLNPGVHLPGLAIIPVLRSDVDHDTTVLRTYAETGPGRPAGVPAAGPNGMVRAVRQRAGALGYLEVTAAWHAGLSLATLEVDGQAVGPEPSRLTAAARAAGAILLSGREPIVLRGPGAYPLSFALSVDLCDNGSLAAGALVRYLVTAGQAALAPAHLGPVPGALRPSALTAVPRAEPDTIS